MRDEFTRPSTLRVEPETRRRVPPVLRALWFHIIVWPALTFAATYAVLFVRYHSGQVVMSRNLGAERNARALAIPEDQRAWSHYRRICIELEPLNEDLGHAWGTVRPGDPLWPDAANYLKRNAGLIERARRTSQIRDFGAVLSDIPDPAFEPGGDPAAPPPGPPSGNPLVITLVHPSLGKSRLLARTLRTDALLAAEERDCARTLDNLVSVCRLARQVAPRGATLIDQLIAQAILATAGGTFMELVARAPGTFDAAALDAIDAELAATLAALTPLDFSTEADFTDDIAQRIFTDDGAGDGYVNADAHANMARLGPNPAPLSIGDRALGPFINLSTTRRDFLAARDELLDMATRTASLPRWQRAQRFSDAAEALLGTESRTDFGIRLIRLLVPAMGKAIQSHDLVSTTTRGVRALIALERHRLAHGTYTESIAALGAAYDPSFWPPDPFDGKPLRYRLIDGWPVLYSIGNNLKDDGGTPPPRENHDAFGPSQPSEGDWILFPPLETGADRLITSPGPWPADRRAPAAPPTDPAR